MVNVCGKRAAAILSKELTAYHKVDNARARAFCGGVRIFPLELCCLCAFRHMTPHLCTLARKQPHIVCDNSLERYETYMYI